MENENEEEAVRRDAVNRDLLVILSRLRGNDVYIIHSLILFLCLCHTFSGPTFLGLQDTVIKQNMYQLPVFQIIAQFDTKIKQTNK